MQRNSNLKRYTSLKSYTPLQSRTPLKKKGRHASNSARGEEIGSKQGIRLKKPKKLKIKRLAVLLWEVTRKRADKLYPPHCYTCPALNLEGSNKQLGHVPWPKSILPGECAYDLRFLRWQCFRCNIHLSGQGAVAYAKMQKENPEALAQMEIDRQVLGKVDADFYIRKTAEYKALL